MDPQDQDTYNIMEKVPNTNNTNELPPRQQFNTYSKPKQEGGCLSFFFRIFGFIFSVFFTIFLLFFMFLCIAVVIAIMYSNGKDLIGEKHIAGSKESSAKIAILPVDGIILGGEDSFVRRAIRQASEDKRIVGIILRVNTPGGTVAGSDYYYYLLKELKKEKSIPIYVSMGGQATSGGYYISMAADKIFAERSTLTGSIGVIFPLYNAAGLCEKIGFSSNAITSGPMKGMGDMTKPMLPEERKIWQELVDESYRQFLDVVKEGRANLKDMPQKKLEEIADGRVYTAQQAKSLGLIDDICFMDDVVRKMIEEKGLNESEVEVIRYQKSASLSDILESSDSNYEETFQKAASALFTPEAYYLAPRTLPIGKKEF